jgi:hypothetical protein
MLVVCSLCLDKVRPSDMMIVEDCYHVFHDTCAAHWSKQVRHCPLCVTPLGWKQEVIHVHRGGSLRPVIGFVEEPRADRLLRIWLRHTCHL